MQDIEIAVPAGRYVVAVSGGVDSVVLLHLLQDLPDTEITVAHFDHGIRPDSAEDRRFVADLAADLGLPYAWAEGRLGAGASEMAAREARYEFLRQIARRTHAEALVTAHHQDDVLETAIFNIIRGTGSSGLASLGSSAKLVRPLLHVPKSDILRYAVDRGLKWREDSTNTDESYRRNYIRRRLVGRIDNNGRREILEYIERARELNRQTDEMVDVILADMTRPGGTGATGSLNRAAFVGLPHAVAREVMAAWLRRSGARDIDRPMLERLVRAGKVYRPGRRADICRGLVLFIGKDRLSIVSSAQPEN